MKASLVRKPDSNPSPVQRPLRIAAIAACTLLGAFALMTTPAHAQGPAQEIALDFISLGDGSDYQQGSYSLGWRFTANRDIKVTDLGFYDANTDGLTESHKVGIYDVATQQLLASTTVAPSDPLTGFFRYHPITPVTLRGGRDYYIVAVTGTEEYAVGVSDLIVNPAISFGGFAVDYSTSSATDLSYPDTYDPGFHGDFGPSFKITNANPQSAAVDMPTLTGSDVNQGSFSMGYLFRPRQDIKVSTLGYYDDKGDGFKQGQHQVAIFHAVQKQLIVNTSISSSDPRRGAFRYRSVPPVTLLAGHDYFVMGENTGDNYRRDVTSLSVSPFIELRGSAFNNQPPTLGPAFPTESHPGEAPFFGPTFEIGGPSQPINISTRGEVKSGTGVMIGGFIVTGSAPKKILIRGLGPSLPISGKLADPVLHLYRGSTRLISNNNWQDNQKSEIEATAIPPPDPKESAIVRTLEPGTYTAVLAPNGDQPGAGLVEAYDLTAGANSKLANISTRGFVGGPPATATASTNATTAEDAPMIGGFIVGSASRYIIRGIGPSLIGAGVPDALKNPTLQVFDGNGAQVAANDDWQESQKDEITATGVAPTDPRESAIVTVLNGGPYTAVLRGKAGTSGVALIEVYNIP